MSSNERQWFIVGRWEEFAGEGRANLLRIIALAAFYVVHLLHYREIGIGWLQFGPVGDEVVSRDFHVQVTALAVVWAMLSMGVLLCQRRRVFPAALKFISTGGDVVLLTALLTVADGPRSPLVVGYFLIVALATLRFNLHLIWCATGGSLAGYLVVLGYVDWFATRDIDVPRYHQAMMMLAIALMGIVLGQVVRRVRAMAEDYARRLAAVEGRP